MRKTMILIAAVTVMGCGQESFSNFCSDYVNNLAKRMSQCTNEPLDIVQSQINQAAPCTNLQTAVNAKRVVYNASQDSACISAIQSMTCDQLFTSGNGPAACQNALYGAAAVGGACSTSMDCAVNDWCYRTSNTCGTGTCKAEIAPGNPCTNADMCTSGYYCGINNTCIAMPAATGTQGQTCGNGTYCKAGLTCDSITSQCTPIVAEGGACQPGHGQCETWAYCNSSTNTCTRDSAANGNCGPTYLAAPPAYNEYQDCLPGLYCTTTGGASNGTCQAQVAAGGACSGQNWSQCQSYSCNASSLTCDPVCQP